MVSFSPAVLDWKVLREKKGGGVWAFYYPQISGIFENFKIGFDEFFHDLSCPGIVFNHPPDLR